MSGCLFVWLSAAWQLARSATSEWHLQIVGLTMLGGVVAYFVNGMFQDVSIIPMINMMLLAWAGMTVNLSAQPLYELKSANARQATSHVRATSNSA